MLDAVASLGPSVGPSAPASFDTSYLNNGGSDFPGIGLFVAFAIFAVFVAIGSMIWRVNTARRLAQDSGLNPDDAARVAFLNDNAVTATYLASSFRRQQEQQRRAQEAPAAPVRSVKARLDELRQLHDTGDISDEEYAEGRKHIINGA